MYRKVMFRLCYLMIGASALPAVTAAWAASEEPCCREVPWGTVTVAVLDGRLITTGVDPSKKGTCYFLAISSMSPFCCAVEVRIEMKPRSASRKATSSTSGRATSAAKPAKAAAEPTVEATGVKPDDQTPAGEGP